MGKGGQVPQRASDFQSELCSPGPVAAKLGRAAPPAARDPLLAAVPREVCMDAASNVPSASYYKDLNDKVADILERQRTGAKTAPPIELSHVVAADGALVYPNRYLWMVWVYSAVAIYLICQAPSPAVVLLGVPAMYLCYDVYSGVTHVNLDDQRNLAGLKSYILFQGCLEFQWHHAIPVDITKKSFVACCADLNIIVAVSVVINCVALRYTTGTAAALTGLKLFGAYFGQYCHRSAHTPKSKRPRVAQYLMDKGFMCPQNKHLGHHKPPHDANFCLVGYCDGIINGMLKHCGTNDWVWFGFWLAFSFGDVYVVNKVLTVAAPSVFAA
ncbi:hypothetical protein JL722_10813 [Aureococcus anophagefferens]|nr:hypothetical protein JL722_10813 [Aureococcus anophagefferens]